MPNLNDFTELSAAIEMLVRVHLIAPDAPPDVGDEKAMRTVLRQSIGVASSWATSVGVDTKPVDTQAAMLADDKQWTALYSAILSPPRPGDDKRKFPAVVTVADLGEVKDRETAIDACLALIDLAGRITQ